MAATGGHGNFAGVLGDEPVLVFELLVMKRWRVSSCPVGRHRNIAMGDRRVCAAYPLRCRGRRSIAARAETRRGTETWCKRPSAFDFGLSLVPGQDPLAGTMSAFILGNALLLLDALVAN